MARNNSKKRRFAESERMMMKWKRRATIVASCADLNWATQYLKPGIKGLRKSVSTKSMAKQSFMIGHNWTFSLLQI